MAFQLVDSWSGTVAVVTAPAEASGRLWAIFLWDPVSKAYIGNIPTMVQGSQAGMRVYAENNGSVRARYYVTVDVTDPDGNMVTGFIASPVDDSLGGGWSVTKFSWQGNVSEVMEPGSRTMPSGKTCAWNCNFTASKVGVYTTVVKLFAEKVV